MAYLISETKNLGGVIIENLLHDSKNILKTSYNYSTKQLVVTFLNGGVYTYSEVPLETHHKLKESESVGKFLNSDIKQFPVRKNGVLPADRLNDMIAEVKTHKKVID